jgi:hypothetical protein
MFPRLRSTSKLNPVSAYLISFPFYIAWIRGNLFDRSWVAGTELKTAFSLRVKIDLFMILMTIRAGPEVVVGALLAIK